MKSPSPHEILDVSRTQTDGMTVPAKVRRKGATWLLLSSLLALSLAAGFFWYPPFRDRWIGADAIWERAEYDLLAGRYDRVDAALKRLARLREPSPLDFLLMAKYAMARHRPDQALTNLIRVPDDHPMGPQARLLAGQIELRRDRVRLAEESFQAALRLNPGLVQARRELIYIYGMQLRRPELNEQFFALSQLTRLTADNLFHWGLLRNSSWEPVEAIGILSRYIAADPQDRWSRLALAENERRMGRRAQAEAALAVLPPDDPQATAIRVQIAVDGQDLDEAERLLAMDTTSTPALARLRGRLALARRDAKAAMRHWQIAYAADPDDRETTFGLLRALELAGESQAALPLRESARKLEWFNTLLHRAATPQARREPQLLRQLGAASAALDRTAEARAWYELAIEADSSDPESQKALYRLRDKVPADLDPPRSRPPG
jgi:tetratricopeptide (TPR) repeat protein